MELFGLSVEQLNQLILGITALLVLVDNIYSKLTHKNVKDTRTQIDETQAVVQELTNGKLTKAVKEAVAEVTEKGDV